MPLFSLLARSRTPAGLVARTALWCLSAVAFSSQAQAQAPAASQDQLPLTQLEAEPLPSRVSFAVVIGNNKSLGGERPNLHYADDDAARYYEILQTMAPNRVSLLANFDRDTGRLFPAVLGRALAPRSDALRDVGAQLAEQVRAANAQGLETEIYFIFAGHGDVAEGEGYIELEDQRFRARELEAWLRAIPFTRAHVILDSCNSFFMLGARKPGGRHFATSEDAARTMAARLPNVGVFLSTSAEGEAFEWSEIQSGVFSHLVRSGLMGAADADADGTVSYLELAAFVDTATSDVRNPNMRPHVFARGPGARDQAAIAELHSLTGVRRFELGDAGALRLRLRNVDGLPLLDAHMEQALALRIAVPEVWTQGATVERTVQASGEKAADSARLPLDSAQAGVRDWFTVPETPNTITLAALQKVDRQSAVRGPDETFHTLFARPYGPAAYNSYVAFRKTQPPPVFGVSKEDLLRMQLVLDELARVERGVRLTEGIGGLSFGTLIAAAGVGVLHVDPEASSGAKRQARWIGGGMVGMGSLLALGGLGAVLSKAPSQETADAFRAAIRAKVDPAQAFAAADKSVRELVADREEERLTLAVVGSALMLGMSTGFVLGELTAEPGARRMYPRLGWGLGMAAGGAMMADALFAEGPTDTLSRIWRDDPSLHQYQVRPAVSVGPDGAIMNLFGTW